MSKILASSILKWSPSQAFTITIWWGMLDFVMLNTRQYMCLSTCQMVRWINGFLRMLGKPTRTGLYREHLPRSC
ncbi:hypothetical protein KC19_12G189600 [Ceratodon purpureus]|uniref:Uncharacterized protein n=1 Tax=Ceratodon purpureus TaxID=3225 RepID=A0A8T0GCG6_CERPU|nr:hypothetical protein KC19_12G189600 [Ceratodon purpureus]